ncbi:hypothetical protein [Flavimarina sp. Hel_I_48]|uniref:hypothetical protein n=1 Tax=Flavimarina sp. Hel_I_48 TaxID=1392488 RepID=UPI00055E5CD7|nr:hypothetical protein [Flavimarina sp. Hel_I_48]
MKKQLKSELVSLAHRILQMNSEVNYTGMQQEAKKLYDTLTVLAFAEKHFDGVNPTIGKAEIIEALQDKNEAELQEIIEVAEEKQEKVGLEDENTRRMDEIAKANEILFEQARNRRQNPPIRTENRPDNTENKPPSQASLYEPVIEKIKDMVAMMPPEADEIDDMFKKITGQDYIKNDRDEIGEYGRMPEFEEKKEDQEKRQDKEDRTLKQEDSYEEKQQEEIEGTRKSLNDRLTKGLKIGLNDRLVFIKHLFNGSAADYNRVLSQLNTQRSAPEALNFIDQMIKPDYNNWDGKEVYEMRFKEMVEKKFNA